MLKLGQLLGSLKGWIYLLTTLIPTVWTYASGALEGLPWSQRVPYTTLALASGAVLAAAALWGYEIVSGWYGLKKEANRLAQDFQDLVNVGQKDMKIGHAAELWAGRDANAYQKLVCLRRLKQAADAGLISYTLPVSGKSSKDSNASLNDLVQFFRRQAWKSLPPLPPQESPRAKPIKSVERRRSSWVTSWRSDRY